MVFESVRKTLEEVAEIEDLDKKEEELLLSFERINKGKIELNGKKYSAFRIVHNDALGPGKGGIRFHPEVSEEETRSLAFWMSIKNSLAGIPYGGAKGGVKINPKKLNEEELEQLSRKYVMLFHKDLGKDKDVPAPDVYTNPKVMGWMLDEFERLKCRHEPGMITAKPDVLGGLSFRKSSTGLGGYIILRELSKKENLKNTKIAVQGFGNVGYHFSRFAFNNSYDIVAVSDSSGGVYDPEGLDISKIKETKEETGSVVNHEGKEITNKELLELDVDILVPAAIENQITEENMDDIKANHVLELANGPTTNKADDRLYQRGIMVIPDILANAGGVMGSYYEWVQNKVGGAFEPSYLKKRFKSKIEENFQRVYEFQQKKDIKMRNAAYILAIRRILKAEKARGHL